MTAQPPDVAAYLASVREALRDLPAAERDDLLAEVEVSLLDAASEGGPIAARLGPPEEFAAELRTAAGLEAPPPPPAPAEDSMLPRLRLRASAWWGNERTVAARRVLGELAPIWWALRGYVAVVAAVLAVGVGPARVIPAIPPLGGVEGGAAAVAVGIAVSIVLGLRGRRRRSARPLALALNVALVVATLPVAAHVADALAGRVVLVGIEMPSPVVPGLAYGGAPVENVYAYSRGGELLHDVLLYDAAGAPLEVRPYTQDPDRRVPLTADGEPLYNVFPIRYFEPGTREVANPNAGPTVAVPEIRTPPLELGEARGPGR